MGNLITLQKTAVAIFVSVTKKHSSRKGRLRATPVLKKSRSAALKRKISVSTGLRLMKISQKRRLNTNKPKIKKRRIKSRPPSLLLGIVFSYAKIRTKPR